LSLTEKWPVSRFDDNLEILKDFEKDKDCISAKKVLDGDYSKTNKNILHAVKIHQSDMQRDIIEALLLAEDCDTTEASELSGVGTDVLEMYAKLFFNIQDTFISKIDLLDYIETGVNTYSKNGNDDPDLGSFLLKRWVISLGKEFVVWRYKLKPIAYAPASLYSTIMKEAFFYHKEKSMGNEQISLSEYLRSTSTLLSSVKGSTAIKEVSEEDAGLDIMDHLGIIIEDKSAPMITLDEIKDGSFVNNATQQETT